MGLRLLWKLQRKMNGSLGQGSAEMKTGDRFWKRKSLRLGEDTREKEERCQGHVGFLNLYTYIHGNEEQNILYNIY